MKKGAFVGSSVIICLSTAVACSSSPNVTSQSADLHTETVVHIVNGVTTKATNMVTSAHIQAHIAARAAHLNNNYVPAPPAPPSVNDGITTQVGEDCYGDPGTCLGNYPTDCKDDDLYIFSDGRDCGATDYGDVMCVYSDGTGGTEGALALSSYTLGSGTWSQNIRTYMPPSGGWGSGNEGLLQYWYFGDNEYNQPFYAPDGNYPCYSSDPSVCQWGSGKCGTIQYYAEIATQICCSGSTGCDSQI